MTDFTVYHCDIQLPACNPDGSQFSELKRIIRSFDFKFKNLKIPGDYQSKRQPSGSSSQHSCIINIFRRRKSIVNDSTQFSNMKTFVERQKRYTNTALLSCFITFCKFFTIGSSQQTGKLVIRTRKAYKKKIYGTEKNMLLFS